MKIIPSVYVQDGAGVKIRRYIGTPYADHIDPFLLLDEIKTDNPQDVIAGFPPHPHRGFQTLTYIKKGGFRHKDSSGGEGEIKDGELQLMNAGSGVIHSEMPAIDRIQKELWIPGKILFWGYQLWINLRRSEKMSEPFYLTYKAVPDDKKEKDGVKIFNLWNEKVRNLKHYIDVNMKKGSNFKFEWEDNLRGFIALSDGEIEIKAGKEKIRVREGYLVEIGEEKEVYIEAREESNFILCLGTPLREPIARWGPIVMNTKQEIIQAIEELSSGTFLKKSSQPKNYFN